MLALTSLKLSHFRSHLRAELHLDGRPVAIHGNNGAGKTNILEAVSLFSPGRGIRRASAAEMARRPESLGWKLSATLQAANEAYEIETWSEGGNARQVKVDNKTANQIALGQIARVVWLVPAMDRLWIEAAEGRRRFLDRVALSFAPSHAEATLTYEKAMRERNKLLKQEVRDPVWYRVIEQQMSDAGHRIHQARLDAVDMLLGIDTVWLEAECSRYDFFLDVVQQTQPDIALVSLDADPEKGLQLIGDIANELPACSVLVVSSSTEGSLILRAMRNGAKEFLNLPVKLEDFMAALDRLRSVSGGSSGESDVQGSQVISIAGVSGGTGCTALAINMACLLAQNDRFSPLVIDLDLTLGDADVWLDIIPEYTIQDVAENISRLDYSLLKRSLTRHECGAFLLPRPVHVENAAGVTSDDFRRIVALLKATFTHLIIDTSKSFGELDMASLEVSDKILLVSQLDLSSLRNLVRLMQYFEQFEGLVDKTEVIVNRIGLSDSDISLNKALETIGREVFWQIPTTTPRWSRRETMASHCVSRLPRPS